MKNPYRALPHDRSHRPPRRTFIIAGILVGMAALAVGAVFRERRAPPQAGPDRPVSVDEAAGARGSTELPPVIDYYPDRAATGAASAIPVTGSLAFDRQAVKEALASVDLSACRQSGGPNGAGHVSITFAPSGRAVSSIVDQPPYAETAAGSCVAGKFRAVKVPPFAGTKISVGKRFSID